MREITRFFICTYFTLSMRPRTGFIRRALFFRAGRDIINIVLFAFFLRLWYNAFMEEFYEDGAPAAKLFTARDVMAALSVLPKSQREKLTTGYDIKALAKIFEDGDMMNTVDAFLSNDLSVCRTARALYMHRNTLMYRLNVIRRQTGFDLRVFKMAVTFKILHCLYMVK